MVIFVNDRRRWYYQYIDILGIDGNAKYREKAENHCYPKIAGSCWYGVDVMTEDISDNMENCVWEPAMVKRNALQAAGEAVCLIISVDETIKNPKSGGDSMADQPVRRPISRIRLLWRARLLFNQPTLDRRFTTCRQFSRNAAKKTRRSADGMGSRHWPLFGRTPFWLYRIDFKRNSAIYFYKVWAWTSQSVTSTSILTEEKISRDAIRASRNTLPRRMEVSSKRVLGDFGKIPGESRGFRENPEDSGRIQRIPGESRGFQEYPEDSRRIQRIQGESEGFQKNSDESWGIQMSPGESRGFLEKPEDSWRIQRILGEPRGFLENPEDSWRTQRILGKSSGFLGNPQGSWGILKILVEPRGSWGIQSILRVPRGCQRFSKDSGEYTTYCVRSMRITIASKRILMEESAPSWATIRSAWPKKMAPKSASSTRIRTDRWSKCSRLPIASSPIA
ncbi:unnamed protein product, partial [Nesidiocoris tenuis]